MPLSLHCRVSIVRRMKISVKRTASREAVKTTTTHQRWVCRACCAASHTLMRCYLATQITSTHWCHAQQSRDYLTGRTVEVNSSTDHSHRRRQVAVPLYTSSASVIVLSKPHLARNGTVSITFNCSCASQSKDNLVCAVGA